MEALRRSTSRAQPLHTAKLSRLSHSNRVFSAAYALALLTLFYRHFKTLIIPKTETLTTLISLLLFAADLVLAFMWTTTQAFRLRPLRRSESPDLLKTAAGDDRPAMDVFVCTADPLKEPPAGVADTALAAMAYDYPPEKLSVYVSDDGGSSLTLFAFFEAAKFAAHWLPFCRKYGVLERSPEAFFTSDSLDGRSVWSDEFEKIQVRTSWTHDT